MHNLLPARRSVGAVLLALAAVTVTALWALIVVAPAIAGASVLQSPAPEAEDGVLLAADWVAIIIGLAIPLVNGLALRPTNPAWVKALVANGVAIVAHSLSNVIQADGSAFMSNAWWSELFITLVAMAAAYFQVWAPIVNPNRNLPTLVPLGDVLDPAVPLRDVYHPERRRAA